MNPFTGFTEERPSPTTKKECDDHYKWLCENHTIRIVAREGYDLVFEDGIRVTMADWQELNEEG